MTRDAIDLSYGELLRLTEGHGTSEIYERIEAQLTAKDRKIEQYKLERDECETILSKDADYRSTTKLGECCSRTVIGLMDHIDQLTGQVEAMKAALDFAFGAIHDAITLDDGLDGATGEACCRIITEAVERGTFDQCKPEDLDNMTKERRKWADMIEAQETQLGRVREALEQAKSVARMATSFDAEEYPIMVKEALAFLDSIKAHAAQKETP